MLRLPFQFRLVLLAVAVALASATATAQDPETPPPVRTGDPTAQDPGVGDPGTQDPPPATDPSEDPDEEMIDDLEIDDLEGLDDLPGLDDFDDVGPAAADGSDAGVRVTNLQGFFETRTNVYFRDRDQGLKDEQWISELQLEFDLRFSDQLTGYLRPRFLIDALDEDLKRTDPLEAYLTWSGDGYDVRAGMLVENWGIADTFNPVDVLNRRDLGTDPIDPERLGELGARVRLLLPGGDTISEPTFSFYAVPVFQEAQFPTEENRFTFAAPPNRLLEDADVSPQGSKRVFLAARSQFVLSTTPANADVQLVVARGPARFPTFEVRPRGTAVDLVPVYFGTWTVGGGVRAVPNADWLADYTLKAEVVYNVPYRTADQQPPELPEEFLQYAFGFDRLFPNVFTDVDQLTLTFEWVGEAGADDFTSTFRPFDDDLLGRVFWEANDFARTSVEARGIYDVEDNELILEGIFERQLRAIDEDLQFRLAVQYFDAARSEPGFFGLFPNNSNVEVALRFDF